MQVTDLQELEKRIYAALAAIKPDGQHFAASVSLGCMAQLLTTFAWHINQASAVSEHHKPSSTPVCICSSLQRHTASQLKFGYRQPCWLPGRHAGCAMHRCGRS